VVSPEEPDRVEVVLHLADELARAFQQASRELGRPVLSLRTDDCGWRGCTRPFPPSTCSPQLRRELFDPILIVWGAELRSCSSLVLVNPDPPATD